MKQKIRMIDLSWSNAAQYDLENSKAVQGWIEAHANSDEELLQIVRGGGHAHIDVRDGDEWRCVSSNPSRCSIVDIQIREGRRLVAEMEQRRRDRQREELEAAIAEADRLSEAAIAEAATRKAAAAERLEAVNAAERHARAASASRA